MALEEGESMKLCGHTIVKNEERYLWFSVTSVIDYLDELLILDTGSTDNTSLIIAELKKKYPNKVVSKSYSNITDKSFTEARQEMLEETNSDWIMLLDGDEIWWDDSIKFIRTVIEDRGDNLESIVTRHYNAVGDIYHYQEEKASKYNIDNNTGHYNLRFVNTHIPGLHFAKPYGYEGLYDDSDLPVQNRISAKRLFVESKCYIHTTHLPRSVADREVMQRSRKIKLEVGHSFPYDFYYPEAFFKTKPDFVSSPWIKLTGSNKISAYMQTPLRKIKRRYWPRLKDVTRHDFE
jgi:glycosyltransferase involved in cell wall biosynthesis